MWSALWVAFSFTAAAILLAVRVVTEVRSGSVTHTDVVLLVLSAAVAVVAWLIAVRRLPSR